MLDKILECIPLDSRFVLIIGDKDVTVPQCVDHRFGHCNVTHRWSSWLQDSRIIHFFVSHLDVPPSDRVTALPVGLNPNEFGAAGKGDARQLTQELFFTVAKRRENTTLGKENTILFTNRVRSGIETWDERGQVSRLCNGSWSSFCSVREFPSAIYENQLQQYRFLLCIHGGGIDPNPNAWLALTNGVIPIMRHFPSDNIYDGLPVLFVGERVTPETGQYHWDLSLLSPQVLQDAVANLSPFFTEVETVAFLMKKLSMAFWWGWWCWWCWCWCWWCWWCCWCLESVC